VDAYIFSFLGRQYADHGSRTQLTFNNYLFVGVSMMVATEPFSKSLILDIVQQPEI
jgi:hypothetical protein